GALLAEAVPVPEHAQQRGRRVDPQGVQPEPAVGHPGVDPYRVPELLLGLRIGAHGVGVDAPQPGQVGRGLRALRAEVHRVPHEPCPRRCAGRPSSVGSLGRTAVPRTGVAGARSSVPRPHRGHRTRGGATAVGCRPAGAVEGGGTRGRRAVTERDEGGAGGVRRGRSGQNEAPDHGGTTGGFVSASGPEGPHIENVRPVRPGGQAELGDPGNFSDVAFSQGQHTAGGPSPTVNGGPASAVMAGPGSTSYPSCRCRPRRAANGREGSSARCRRSPATHASPSPAPCRSRPRAQGSAAGRPIPTSSARCGRAARRPAPPPSTRTTGAGGSGRGTPNRRECRSYGESRAVRPARSGSITWSD